MRRIIHYVTTETNSGDHDEKRFYLAWCEGPKGIGLLNSGYRWSDPAMAHSFIENHHLQGRCYQDHQ